MDGEELRNSENQGNQCPPRLEAFPTCTCYPLSCMVLTCPGSIALTWPFGSFLSGSSYLLLSVLIAWLSPCLQLKSLWKRVSDWLSSLFGARPSIASLPKMGWCQIRCHPWSNQLWQVLQRCIQFQGIPFQDMEWLSLLEGSLAFSDMIYMSRTEMKKWRKEKW